MTTEIILTLLGGAIIGYCTNWLAIKMLFKPYTEKRILGIKVPFTPGVIPKERRRMASKIGEVIEEYLLTDQLIVDELSSEATIKQVTHFIENKLFLKTGQLDIQFLTEVMGKNPQLLDHIYMMLSEKVQDTLLSEDTKKHVIEGLSPTIIDYMKETDKADLFHGSLDDIFSKTLTEPYVKEALTGYLTNYLHEDKKLTEILPTALTDMIGPAIRMNTLKIMDEIRHSVGNDLLKEKVITMIDVVVHEKAGGLGAMFINAEDVYATVIDKIDHELDDQDQQKVILDFILEKVAALLDKQLYEVMPSHLRSETIDVIANTLLDRLADKTIIRDILGKQPNSIYDMVNEFTDIDELISVQLGSLYDQVLGSVDQDMIISGIKTVIGTLDETKLMMPEGFKETLNNTIATLYKHFIQTSASDFLSEISIGKLVEREINAFETEMIESIILDIANKELKAITYFGALLGFAMAIIIVIIQ